jgi:hypothetical protein
MWLPAPGAAGLEIRIGDSAGSWVSQLGASRRIYHALAARPVSERLEQHGKASPAPATHCPDRAQRPVAVV